MKEDKEIKDLLFEMNKIGQKLHQLELRLVWVTRLSLTEEEFNIVWGGEASYK
jgi:hypothetical protein